MQGKESSTSLIFGSNHLLANDSMEDEIFSQALKKLNIEPEVEAKLLALKEFIFKTPAHRAAPESKPQQNP